jgi:predicted RNA-binding Zn ribbon-like protein
VDFTSYSTQPVRLAVDLVNTHNPRSGRDDLADEAALSRFLDERLGGYPPGPSPADLRAIKEVRERLRAVFSAHDEGEAAATLNSLLAESGALPQLTEHDGEPWHLHFSPPETPVASRLAAETAMGLAVVIAESGFDRLHVCESEDCFDVFVDESRNKSRRFCSPYVCGNRASVAAYRGRQRAKRTSDSSG